MTRIAGLAFGCSTNLMNNPADIVRCIEALPPELEAVEIEIEEGFRTVLASADEAGRQRLADALLDLSDRQARHYAIHAPWHGPGLSLCTSEHRELARAALLLAIDFAGRVRAPIVTFHPGLADDAAEREIVGRLLVALEPIVPVAEDAGVTLCMENMGGMRSANCLLSLAAHAEIWEKLGVRTCLDLPHAASRVATAAALEDYVDEIVGLVGHVHLADTRIRVHRHLPLGLGELDLIGIFRRLAAGGYRGSVVVEEWNRGHPPAKYVAHAAMFAALHGD